MAKLNGLGISYILIKFFKKPYNLVSFAHVIFDWLGHFGVHVKESNVYIPLRSMVEFLRNDKKKN